MLKDITLGQFFPGNSVIHRLDPRTKLIALIVYIVALFSAGSWLSYGLVFAFLAGTIAISKIPVKAIVRGLKPLVICGECQKKRGELAEQLLSRQ